MAGATSFVKMPVQRCWELLSTSDLLLNRLVTTQLCFKYGLLGSEEGYGLPRKAQEMFIHVPHCQPLSLHPGLTAQFVLIRQTTHSMSMSPYLMSKIYGKTPDWLGPLSFSQRKTVGFVIVGVTFQNCSVSQLAASTLRGWWLLFCLEFFLFVFDGEYDHGR